ncbi:NHLP bacteriocin system secretion protein [Microseira wollei]|uniref:Chromosome segregation ATPase-like protein n=1 Tax=Microseira wollei NIES-4236 TaxID=2530354 RepID=A0AAV3X5U4_9CYAN|nr:NHLP bacteriocin system secretion protein [Microseira wollei]GET37488.1 chromosome segregation ATPase-like protein [Microseira wollei NIES-4236]
MLEQKHNLFRQESLERLSSPERLDQLMQVVSPKSWLPLFTLGSLVFVAIVWSIYGRIPITVEGRGVLIYPRKVLALQSKTPGQLLSLNVKVGDFVKKGDAIATINQADLRKQLEQQRAKLTELESQDRGLGSVQQQRIEQEKIAIQQQRQYLQQRIAEFQALTPVLKAKSSDSIIQQRQYLLQRIAEFQTLSPVLKAKGSDSIIQQRQYLQQRIAELQTTTPVLKAKSSDSIIQQRRSLQQRIAELQSLTPILQEKARDSILQQRQGLEQTLEKVKAMNPIFQKRMEIRRKLFEEEKAISSDLVLDAQQQYLQNLEKISNLETQLKELDVKQAEEEKSYRENLSSISNLQTQLKELDVKQAQEEKSYRENFGSIANLQTQLKDLDVKQAQEEKTYRENLGSIANFRAQLKDLDVKQAQEEKSYRENLGNISNFQAQLKDLDSREANLAKESLETTTNRTREIQELKREIARLELQLNNESQIISQHSGRILEIAVNPGEVVNAGTRLATIDEENSTSKLVGVTYFPIKEGKKFKTGMKVQITPETVKRERFGGIVGTVTSVSPFPITKEAAMNLIGNPEIVAGLVSNKQEGVMQVFSELEPDSTTFSGYKWSSSTGPQLKISPGTTTIVRVKVEERAPITYVLPILRSFSGIF